MRILTDPSSLAAFCREATAAGSIALDMEFERERTYRPILQLIQIATPSDAVIVDPLALADLSALWEVVGSPDVETILHAAAQDMEIFYDKTGCVPRRLFDTQVAAALLGMGEQPGYADLLRRVLGLRLKKHERITDWGRRPLSPAQLDYALDDVRYLPQLRDRLHADLERMGRLEWLEEELAHFAQLRNYERDPQTLWMRVARHRSLDGRGLAVLRELAIWREEEARRRNVPRGRVVQDDVLVEVARRQPRQEDDLRVLRRLNPREIERSVEVILATVRRALEIPQQDYPVLPPLGEDDPELDVTIDLLSVFVRNRAREAKIAASYLATKRELSDLVAAARHQRNRNGTPLLLQGWRYELVGRDLLRLMQGQMVLRVDPRTSRVQIIERE
jgi:ribonuclease D